MLREVKNKHFRPRIVPYVATTTASAGSLSLGYGDITASRGGQAVPGGTLKTPFSRNCGLFCTQSGVTGGYASINATSSGTTNFSIQLNDQAGTAQADGNVAQGFLFGFDSSDVNLCKEQRVITPQNGGRICWGKVTGTSGVVAVNPGGFTCTRTAAGTYTITFTPAFGAIPSIMVTGVGTSSHSSSKVTSITANGCIVTMSPNTGTPTDYDFYLVAIGQDSRSDAGKNRVPLLNSQRKPRCLFGEVTNTGGTLTLTIGGDTGGIDFTSLTDKGAGDFSVTIAEPFKREPAIVTSTTGQRSQVHSYAANVIRIQTKNAAGSNTDTNGVTHFFVIGSDDASSY